MTVSKVLSLATRVKTIFESSEIHEKRALLNYLIQNPTLNGKKLYFTIASPYNLVLDLASKPTWYQLKYAISVIQPNDEQFRAVIEALKKAHADQDKVKTNAFSRVNTELTKVTSKISKLFDLYLEGDITNEEYKTKRIELNVQKEKLERKLASLDGAVDEWYSNAITIMNLVKDAPLLFEESSEAVDKRRLLDMLFQNLEIFDDQLRWKYKKPFNLMVSYTNTSSWLSVSV